MALSKIEIKILKILLNSKMNSEIAHYSRNNEKEARYYEKSKEATLYKNIKEYHYSLKDSGISKCINILNGMKHSHIKYKIEKEDDQNGNPSTIIYFHFKWEGRSWQISFHSFSHKEGNKGDQTLFWHGLLENHVEGQPLQQKFYYELSRILNKKEATNM